MVKAFEPNPKYNGYIHYELNDAGTNIVLKDDDSFAFDLDLLKESAAECLQKVKWDDPTAKSDFIQKYCTTFKQPTDGLAGLLVEDFKEAPETLDFSITNDVDENVSDGGEDDE